MYTMMLHFCYILVPQIILVSVIPTVDEDNVLFQVIINVSILTGQQVASFNILIIVLHNIVIIQYNYTYMYY